MKEMNGSMVPLVAVGVGLAGAGLWYGLGDVGSHTPAAVMPAAAVPAEAGTAFAVKGRVLEVIDVPNYTYLRVADSSGAERWAAVSTSPVEIGETVAIGDATEMKGFESHTLGRTFHSIWFGELQAGAPRSGLSPHGTGMDPHGGESSQGSGMAAPGDELAALPAYHRAPLQGGDDVAVGDVVPASGHIGRRIADLYAGRSTLAGQKVRVRGVVIRSVSGILGRSFVHVRDGSGDASAATHDLTVTTQAEPKVGETVLFEGTVAIDKDFGSGYTYPVLLEGATVLKE